MRSVFGVLLATGALAVVPGDVYLYDAPDGRTGPVSQAASGPRAGLADLGAADPVTRAHAACEAGLTGTPGGLGAIPALISLLADEAHVDAIDCGGEGEWRNRGIFALADTTVPCGTSPALEAARALGRFGGAALAPLMSALGDPRAPVRMHAARAVAWMDDPVAAGGAVQRLVAMLADPDAEVRRVIAGALGVLKDEHAVEPLVRTLKDQDVRVRAGAAAALGSLEAATIGPRLAGALKDTAWEVRQEAARALGTRE
jgi:HEAT repeat protein